MVPAAFVAGPVLEHEPRRLPDKRTELVDAEASLRQTIYVRIFNRHFHKLRGSFGSNGPEEVVMSFMNFSNALST